MVAIEHRQKSSSAATTTSINATVLSPTSSSTSSSSTTTTTSSVQHPQQQQSSSSKMNINAGDGEELKISAGAVSKSAVSQRNVDIKIGQKSNMEVATKELTKKVLKLDLTGNELDDFSLKSPKSPIARLPHQTSLTSSVDMEDRKSLRGALYQGIFHRHRKTIFAVGSFLRMLRNRDPQYNNIRSSSEGQADQEAPSTAPDYKPSDKAASPSPEQNPQSKPSSPMSGVRAERPIEGFIPITNAVQKRE